MGSPGKRRLKKKLHFKGASVTKTEEVQEVVEEKKVTKPKPDKPKKRRWFSRTKSEDTTPNEDE